MDGKKLGFEEFILAVDREQADFVKNLHQSLTERGCKIEVKEAKSGYLVSYLFNKKTAVNFVFRKNGLIVRIYANHINRYSELLDTLPNSMVKAIADAPVCKRLINPDDCNSKCAKGYDFLLKGERMQKCRNGAFMFPVCAENNPFIEALILNEIQTCC